MRQKAVIPSGRSRFVCLRYQRMNFQIFKTCKVIWRFLLSKVCVVWIDRTGFAMANQTVRYTWMVFYWKWLMASLRVVSTDGPIGWRRRSWRRTSELAIITQSLYVPRKGVFEIKRVYYTWHAIELVQLGYTALTISVQSRRLYFHFEMVDGISWLRIELFLVIKKKSSSQDRLRAASGFLTSVDLSNGEIRGVTLIFRLTANAARCLPNTQSSTKPKESVWFNNQGDNWTWAFKCWLFCWAYWVCVDTQEYVFVSYDI